MLNRFTQAKANVLDLVKRRALLEDPRVTGDHVTALMFSSDAAALQNFVMEVFQAGGARAGFEFQLIYHELRSSARWSQR